MSGASRRAAFDFTQWMDRDLLAEFRRTVKRRTHIANEVIYIQDEPGREMFRIVEGSVRLSLTRQDGREVVFILLEPGDCFGDSSLVDGGPRPQTAQAMTPTILEVLSLASFRRLRSRHRSFDDALLKLLARQMRAVSTHYADASLNDLGCRVAKRLVAATRSFGVAVDGGTLVSLRIPQSEIASMVGASRQSVNKVIRGFQKRGLLRIANGRIIVRDLPRLASAAND